MLEDIEHKIATFQRENKKMLNQMEETRNSNEKTLDEIFLNVIEILDVFNREEKIIIDHEWNTSDDSKKVIKRYGNVRKKLQSFLSNYSIKRIEFENNMSNDDSCTIVETDPDPSKPDGTIISIEKEGYTRNSHVLRRAEVITVKN